MKIKLILLILIVGCTSSVAQVSFGVKAGYNINFYVRKIDYVVGPSTNESSDGGGYFLGAFIRVPVSKKFFITPELQFSKRGGFFFSDNYLELPVLATYSLHKIADLDLGINTGVRLFSTIGGINGSPVDFGITGGFRVNLSNKFSLIGRYYFGLIPVRVDDKSSITFNGVTLDPTYKSWNDYHRTIQVGIGYKLK